MPPDGVHPDEMWELRVADTDVARDALSIATAGPAAEHGRHVQQDMLPVLMVRRKVGDAWC